MPIWARAHFSSRFDPKSLTLEGRTPAWIRGGTDRDPGVTPLPGVTPQTDARDGKKMTQFSKLDPDDSSRHQLFGKVSAAETVNGFESRRGFGCRYK